MVSNRPGHSPAQESAADDAPGESAFCWPPSSALAAVLLVSAGTAVALVCRIGCRLDLAAYVLVLAGFGPALSAVDIRCLRLPDRLVFPGAVAGAVLLGAAALAQGHESYLLRAGAGGAAAFLFLYALAWIGPGRLGFGDVKVGGLLLGPLLAWSGWTVLFAAGLLAFTSGGLTGALLKHRSGSGELPFGPSLFAAAAVAVLLCGPPTR